MVTDPKLAAPFAVSYGIGDAYTKDPASGVTTFNFHPTAKSVIGPHSFNFVFIQACVAILILVGFESVTAMGEEAKNPKKDIGRAVLLSLVIQGAFCYLIEYFAANYLLHNGYTRAPGLRVGGAHMRHDGHCRHLALRELPGRQGPSCSSRRSRCSSR